MGLCVRSCYDSMLHLYVTDFLLGWNPTDEVELQGGLRMAYKALLAHMFLVE